MDERTRAQIEWDWLRSLEQPTTAGRRLDAVGFVLGGSFDALLRQISVEYLQRCWHKLSGVLERHQIVCEDLSWGWLHGGEAGLLDTNSYDEWQLIAYPSDFIGWTSCELFSECQGDELWKQCAILDEELKNSAPSLRCTATWRSKKWSIAPQDFALGMRFVEAMCVGDASDWNVEFVLKTRAEPDNIWREVAFALREDDQLMLDDAIEKARLAYTPLGLRILLRGYQSYIETDNHDGKTTRLAQMGD